MRRIVFIIFLLFIGFYNVSAKDISYSLNKYDDEKFNYIEKAYNSELKEDGYVLGGSFLKEKIENGNEVYNDYQVMLVKYDGNDRLVWKYVYGNTKADYIDYLDYTYDESGNIDGYLIVTKRTYDVFEDYDMGDISVVIKIGFDGKLIYEREVPEGIITKIISITNSDNIVDGYIGILNTQIGASLIKYDKNFQVVSRRDFNEASISDVAVVNDNSKSKGFALIVGTNLITVDSNLANDVVIGDVSKYETYNLKEANNGFILYGITSEVKLKRGNSSYYLINYDNNQEVWETIGETATSEDEKMILLPIVKDTIKEYFLLYKNEIDSSYEVVKISLDGDVLEKVKKIKNNYYDFENFYSTGTTIYFIGQINCPDDDSCDYDNNSLFLVSDEDKVIEVMDDTSRRIMAICAITFIVLVGAIVFVRKTKRK